MAISSIPHHVPARPERVAAPRATAAAARTGRRKKILFVCGSINQTTQMHQIANELSDYDCVFSPYYGNRDFDFLKEIGALEYTIGGKKLTGRCLDYLRDHHLPLDLGGRSPDIDLAFQCSDLVRPKNLWGRRVILVQEGMTDPESIMFPLVRRFRGLYGWLAGTSAFGLSGQYQRLCVASPGYRDLFVNRGAPGDRILVTGIPNFDDCEHYRRNDFPHHGFVLCCTSDVRETFFYEDRKAFIDKAVRIAAGRKLVFKLHPNEMLPRAIDEVRRYAPNALVYTTGLAEHMVANCDVLICKYSSLAYVGLALGKEVYSLFQHEELRRLLPLQNRRAAKNIASVARNLLGDGPPLWKDATGVHHAPATGAASAADPRFAASSCEAFRA